MEQVTSYDVVVVGSGAGGLVGALSAAAAGLRVLLVEKSEHFGGTTALSGAGLWAPANQHVLAAGQPDGLDVARTYLAHTVGDRTPQAMQEAFLASAAATIGWLEEQGVRFVYMTGYPDYHPDQPGGLLTGRAITPKQMSGARFREAPRPIVSKMRQGDGGPPIPPVGPEGPVWGGQSLIAQLLTACVAAGVDLWVDYSTYDQPDAVRYSVGMGQPMDDLPLMVAPGVPTMIWGGQVRLMARALGVELDEIREHVERRALTETVSNPMGTFDAGTQGGLWFEVQGISSGEPVIVVEHVTRIDAGVAPDWPSPDGAGAHRIVLEGRPRIVVTIEAEDEGGNRAAGGNATAVARLVNAIPWLRAAAPGLYDGLQVPLSPAVGRLA